MQSDLKSGDGFVFTDIDYIAHRCITHIDGRGTRDIQAIMVVEVKAYGADVSESQRDTLNIIDKFLLTLPRRRERAAGRFIKQHGEQPKWVHSTFNGRKVTCFSFGAHKLILSGTCPENSEWMTWDKKPITRDQLVKLLRFELHPVSLNPYEFRRHKKRRPVERMLFEE